MLSKILDWSISVQPEWAGFVVLCTVAGLLILLAFAAILAVVAVTRDWALLAIPAFILAAIILATWAASYAVF